MPLAVAATNANGEGRKEKSRGTCFPAVVVFILITVGTLNGQMQAPTSNSSSLSKPVDWGIYTSTLFKNSREIGFHLVTSWIPGENRKGMFRYRLDEFPKRLFVPNTPKSDAEVEEDEQLMNRASQCSIWLKLYDADGFILRKILVHFSRGVDEHGRLHSLGANDAVQMDAQEYRTFLKDGGSWNVSWACVPPIPQQPGN